MPTGYHPPLEVRQKISSSLKGIKRSSETREKMTIANSGRHHSKETKDKMSLTRKGVLNVGTKFSEERKKAMSLARKGIPMFLEAREKLRKTWTIPEVKAKHKQSMLRVWDRIEKEAIILKEQGFRVIPITTVVPDIVAVKDNKVYAIEVEYGMPNYAKYTKEITSMFDDVIWILRK